MSEYADGFDDGKGEKFDELMVEIVNLRLDSQNCEAKRVGAINSLREHINICNWLKIENAVLRNALSRLIEVHDAMGGMCSPERILAEEALKEEGK
jgi:hypothetical protein